ncbi:Palmitoyltransferase zdhhc14 [Actinomortierella ambigua]|uniref:Palmitoyltransferase n=1 Tax=Actinomortierella ambigua TaxID=1343610 RepID=A0A9P6U0D0_9FUNG|nr:Palmitoyltransferase zdhhc14 [Actinomortierella ambigua]
MSSSSRTASDTPQESASLLDQLKGTSATSQRQQQDPSYMTFESFFSIASSPEERGMSFEEMLMANEAVAAAASAATAGDTYRSPTQDILLRPTSPYRQPFSAHSASSSPSSRTTTIGGGARSTPQTPITLFAGPTPSSTAATATLTTGVGGVGVGMEEAALDYRLKGRSRASRGYSADFSTNNWTTAVGIGSGYGPNQPGSPRSKSPASTHRQGHDLSDHHAFSSHSSSTHHLAPIRSGAGGASPSASAGGAGSGSGSGNGGGVDGGSRWGRRGRGRPGPGPGPGTSTSDSSTEELPLSEFLSKTAPPSSPPGFPPRSSVYQLPEFPPASYQVAGGGGGGSPKASSPTNIPRHSTSAESGTRGSSSFQGPRTLYAGFPNFRPPASPPPNDGFTMTFSNQTAKIPITSVSGDFTGFQDYDPQVEQILESPHHGRGRGRKSRRSSPNATTPATETPTPSPKENCHKNAGGSETSATTVATGSSAAVAASASATAEGNAAAAAPATATATTSASASASATAAPRTEAAAAEEEQQQQQQEQPHENDLWVRRYKVFPGRNVFLLKGRIMTSRDFPAFTVAVMLVLVPTGLFHGFVSPYLWHHLSPAAPLVQAYLFIVAFSTMLKTSWTDPGVIPRGLDSDPPLDLPLDYGDGMASSSFYPPKGLPRVKEIQVGMYTVRLKYCDTCRIYRPPRCSHCRQCDNCVEDEDHHCIWLNNCIGRRNYKYFWIFVTTAAVYALLTASLCLTHLLMLYNERKDDVAGRNFGHAMGRAPVSTLVMLFAFVMGFAVGALAGYHYWLATMNRTTHEQLGASMMKPHEVDNPFDRGSIPKNCAAVLCRPPTKSYVRRRDYTIV